VSGFGREFFWDRWQRERVARPGDCRGPGAGRMLPLMDPRDSALDTAALAYARALLRKPDRRQKMGPVLGAAAFAALCAVAFAATMVMAPANVTQHLPQERLDRGLGE
jgi:hypothetical protein